MDELKLMNGPLEVIPKDNPYNRIEWQDDLVDPVTGEVLEEGTTFWAEYANNIEWGIFNAYASLGLMYRELQKLQALMELDGRAPNNNGTFADIFEQSLANSNFERLLEKTDVVADVVAGSTVIPVADASIFEPMTFVTLFDADSYEHVQIASVDEANKTITVSAVVNDYTKGAKVARSTANIDANNQTLDVAPLVTYNVNVVEVV